MLNFDVAASFFGISLLLAVVPGPDNLFVLTNAAVAGRRAGWLVTLGLCTGLVVHTLLVLLGLTALLQSSDRAIDLMRVFGAIYLIYLAWRAFLAPPLDIESSGQRLAGNWYVRGIVLNLTNPKVALFFLAFLPQFIDDEYPVEMQIVQLGVLFILATLIIFGSIATLAGHVGQRLRRSSRMQAILNRSAALVFVLLAVRLFLEHR